MDAKAYVERVIGSERGFKHFTKCEDIVIPQDAHSLLHKPPLSCTHHDKHYSVVATFWLGCQVGSGTNTTAHILASICQRKACIIV